jgi:tagatose 1,6-diphosphate aldolase
LASALETFRRFAWLKGFWGRFVQWAFDSRVRGEEEAMTNPNSNKEQRLRSLSTSAGIIAALAMDQRKSLRRLIANAAGVLLESIADQRLAEFKNAVCSVLSPHASAILLDPEYGLEAAGNRAHDCGLLLAYESDGYENPRPNRMLALMPQLSVRTLRDRGAAGVKILLHYSPFDDAQANEEKKVLIERIGCECSALDMPFFLEPVLYAPQVEGRASPSDFEFAKAKPPQVIELMREFSLPIYHVDILKVEFPVTAMFVEGAGVFAGQAAYSMEEALDFFRAADAAAGCPYIYLSAGVSTPVFFESLQMATRAGAKHSGVLCGRATWQGGVAEYATKGVAAFERWLEREGVQNVKRINELLSDATPWHARYAEAQV